MKNRRRLGAVLTAAGFVLLLAAGGLLWFNQTQSLQAETACRRILPQLAAVMTTGTSPLPELQGQAAEAEAPVSPDLSSEDPAEVPQDPTVTVDGVDYLGVISFPSLSLELPVMAQWSYEGLRTAPGRYSGSAAGKDLVIAGHNYSSQLGALRELSLGDEVLFTNAAGTVYSYAVLDVEILQPTAVAEMTAGEYPLTVFTCTYGGRTRLTIRCG